MSNSPTPQASALRIAIIGSGPAGLFAAEELLATGKAGHVDVYEQEPLPYGLVRYGVAPDHPRTRAVTKLFERTVSRPGFHIISGVRIGTNPSVDQLREHYHAIVVATGAEEDRTLGIPGETLAGCHASLEFAGWVNGHPDFAAADLDLSCDTVVVIGNGNVALDVARILTRPVDQLATTDIAPRALEVLRGSSIRTIYVIGRRGPHETSFGPNEIAEMPAVANCLAEDVEGFSVTGTHTAAEAKRDVYETLRSFKGNGEHSHRIVFRFFHRPLEIVGSSTVTAVRFDYRGTQKDIACGLVVKSIGHQGNPVPGLPFDEAYHVIPVGGARIVDGGKPVPGCYAVGWIARGAKGLIGHNRRDAVELSKAIAEDAAALTARTPASREDLLHTLRL